MAQPLSDVVLRGEDALNGEDYEEAESAFWAVARGVLGCLFETHDQGELRAQVGRAVEGLGRCFLAQDSASPRRQLLKRLRWVIAWDIQEGGGLGFTEAALPALAQ